MIHSLVGRAEGRQRPVTSGALLTCFTPRILIFLERLTNRGYVVRSHRHLPYSVHRRRRAAIAAAVAGVLAVGLSAPAATSVAVAAVPRADTAATPAEKTAGEQAVATGQPVVVDSETTETEQVTANPDGSYTLNSSVMPQRVQAADGDWTPIDTTLHLAANGTLSPSATAQPVAFSDGGTAPLITVTGTGDDAGKQVAFSWPTALPTPTVTGNTATYANVLPDVDLQVAALPTSFSEILVVKSAAAAANPALTSLQLAATGTGVSVGTNAVGGLEATDPATGEVVFNGSPATMWDSSRNVQIDSTTPTAQDPGSGLVTPVAITTTPTLAPSPKRAQTSSSSGASTTSSTVDLSVPTAALTGPNVTYPVYIDPPLQGAHQHYAVVLSAGDPYYDDSSQHPKVGYCGYSGCAGIGTARAYFQVNTGALRNTTTGAPAAHIFSAAFSVTEIHNGPGGCVSTPVQLYQSGAFTSGITWGGPITSQLQQVSSDASDNCPSHLSGAVTFNNSTVVSYVQAAANSDSASMYFALKAPNESDATQWKQFNNDASLVVNYDYAPSLPFGLTIAGQLACPNKPVYTTDTSPTLDAEATDYNPSPPNQDMFLSYAMQDTAGNNERHTHLALYAKSNTLTPWSLSDATSSSTTPVPNGAYGFHVSATTGTNTSTPLTGPQTPWYFFDIDNVAPATPTITSFDYPTTGWGKPAGQGSIAVSSAGATTIAYKIDSSAVTTPTASTCAYSMTAAQLATNKWIDASSATISTAGLAIGRHTLYVRSFDDAHNVSATSSYVFYVAPTVVGVPGARLEAESLTGVTATDGDHTVLTPGDWANPAISGGHETYAPITMVGGQMLLPFTVPAVTAGTATDTYYSLGVGFVDTSDAGIVKYGLDPDSATPNGTPLQSGQLDASGNVLTVQTDTYTSSPTPRYQDVGGVHLIPGSTHTLAITIVGTNTASSGARYHIDVDYLSLTPIQAPQDQSFTAARNNLGIAVDNTTAADIGPDPAHSGFSQNALVAAGFPFNTTNPDTGPATVTVDGVAFPIYKTGTDSTNQQVDNVMADGQTIQLATDADHLQANYIDLLATATCGTIPANPGLVVTVNYFDPTIADPTQQHYPQNGFDQQLPTIPDWASGTVPPAGTPGITLAADTSYYDVGATPSGANQHRRLFHIQIPTDDQPTAYITSITLPNIGSSFTDACSEPALHIFSITTSN